MFVTIQLIIQICTWLLCWWLNLALQVSQGSASTCFRWSGRFRHSFVKGLFRDTPSNFYWNRFIFDWQGAKKCWHSFFESRCSWVGYGSWLLQKISKLFLQLFRPLNSNLHAMVSCSKCTWLAQIWVYSADTTNHKLLSQQLGHGGRFWASFGDIWKRHSKKIGASLKARTILFPSTILSMF